MSNNPSNLQHEKMIEAIRKISDNQANIVENNKKIRELSINLSSQLEDIDIKLKRNNELVEKNTIVIDNNNVIMDAMRDLVKEFSIYASNREKMDENIRESMEVLSETWNSSLQLFGEMRTMIDGIHNFADQLTNERIRIISNIESTKYPGLSLFQEWLTDLVVEIIYNFSYTKRPHEMVTIWTKDRFIAYLHKFGTSGKLSFDDIDDRVKFAETLLADIHNEYKVTEFFDIIYWSVVVMFQCTMTGVKFIDHPKIGEVITITQKYEGMIYE